MRRSTAAKRTRGRTVASDDEILRAGAAALRSALGIDGTLRFLRMIAPQAGEYAEVRKNWESMTLEEIAKLGEKK